MLSRNEFQCRNPQIFERKKKLLPNWNYSTILIMRHQLTPKAPKITITREKRRESRKFGDLLLGRVIGLWYNKITSSAKFLFSRSMCRRELSVFYSIHILLDNHFRIYRNIFMRILGILSFYCHKAAIRRNLWFFLENHKKKIQNMENQCLCNIQ